MRALVFLLILLNLVFFAWARGSFSPAAAPEGLPPENAASGDKIVVVSRGTPPSQNAPASLPASPSTAPSEKPADKAPEKTPARVTETCLAWQGLPLADVERAEALIADKLAAFKPERELMPGEATYWVFIPPLPSKAEADKKATELKKLKVQDFKLIQDVGPSRFAISLGIFSTQTAAEDRLVALRSLGVRSAKLEERPRKTTIRLTLRGPEPLADEVKQAIGNLLPDARPAECKAAAPQ